MDRAGPVYGLLACGFGGLGLAASPVLSHAFADGGLACSREALPLLPPARRSRCCKTALTLEVRKRPVNRVKLLLNLFQSCGRTQLCPLIHIHRLCHFVEPPSKVCLLALSHLQQDRAS